MSNNKQIAKNITYSSISFILNFCVSFFLSPYLIRTLGKEAYGFFPLINNIIEYTSIVTAVVGSMAGRFITMSYYQDKIEEAKGYFNSAIVAYMIMSLFFCVLGIVFVIFINNFLNVPYYLLSDVRWVFGITLIGFCLSLCTNLFGIGTYVKNRLDWTSKASMISKCIYVAFVLILFYYFKPTIVFISIASFISTLYVIYINFNFKRKLIPEINFQPKKYFSWKKLRTLTSSGIWMSFNQLSNILVTTVDLLLANIFINAATTGDFAVSKTVPSLITSIVFILSSSFFAQFNILYAKHQYDELVHETRKSMIILSVLVSIPLGFFLISSDYFFQVWIKSAYDPIMFWLSFISLIGTISGLATTPLFGIFTATDKRKVPAIALMIVGLLNIIIVYFALKETSLGVLAIPLTSTVLLGIRNIFFTPIYGAMCLGLKKWVFYPPIIKSWIAIAITIIFTLLARHLMYEISWSAFFLNFFVVALVSLGTNYYIILTKSERNFLVQAIKNKIKI